MQTALIISLNFNPGHVSHMVASYMQCEELGYSACCYVNPAFERFLPQGFSKVTSNEKCPHAAIAIFLFPSQKNLPLIWKLRRRGTKIYYIFHEPLAPMSVYWKAGFGWKYLIKLWVIDHISALTVKASDAVLIPSERAVGYYEANKLYKNQNYHYLPLMYDDEMQERHARMPRMYFSYIGTIAADHSFDEFIAFVEWAVKNEKLPEAKFLIATKSAYQPSPFLQESSRITILQGRPLSDEEINAYYASTLVVWNAYERTTQSGVLAKSFMFGTPAIVLRKNLSEFTTEGKEVVAIDDNKSFEQIENACKEILSHFNTYSEACRSRFQKTFYYRNYNETLNRIIQG